MKFCPNCGAAVEAGAESCESCGTDLAAAQAAIASSAPVVPSGAVPGAAQTVADLTPRQLRKEIRWGVFQGIAIVALIVFIIYLAIFVIVAVAVGSGNVSILSG